MSKLKNIAGKVVGVLPVGSLFSYISSGIDVDGRKEKNPGVMLTKIISHTTYAVVGTYAITAWITQLTATGKANPLGQMEFYEQRRAELKEESEKANVLYNEIFGESGLADINKDGKVSVSERARAYESVGLEKHVYFTNLNSGQLNQVKDIYLNREEE